MTDEFLAEAARRRAAGQITTHYVCCGPGAPNTFLSSSSGEAFWCGFYPAVAGLDGMLRWAWNSWGKDTMRDGSYAHWRAGDTYLVYPDGSPSWRFLELRAGICAAEKYRILREKGEMTAELDILAKKYVLKDALRRRTPYGALRDETKKTLNR